MSLDAIQSHKRPGLASANFGSHRMGIDTKSTGVSSQAATNLKNSSAASSSNSVFNGMFKKNSSFNRVGGQNALKGRNQVDLGRRRASLGNNGVSRSTEAGTPVHIAGTPQMPKQSGLQKAMMYGSYALQNFAMGAKLFGGLSNGQQLDASMAAMGGASGTPQLSSTAGQSVISGMQNAQTSGELTAAISNAESQLATMQQTATSGNFETKANDAKTNMDTYKSDVSSAKNDFKDAEQNLKTADASVKTATDLRDSRLLALKNADAQYGAAVEARVQAQDGANQASQNLATAENQLANTPATLPDGSTNPQRAAAEQAVEQAKAAKQAADAKLDTAKQAESQAESTRDKTNTAANDAKANLDKAQDTLDKQKSNQTKMHAALITADAKYKTAQETYQKAQDDVQKFQEYQHDTKELQGQIAKQKERLQKMRDKEDKRIDKLERKVDKAVAKNESTNNKIHPENGMNLREKYLSGRIESRNEKNAARLAERDAIRAGQG